MRARAGAVPTGNLITNANGKLGPARNGNFFVVRTSYIRARELGVR